VHFTPLSASERFDALHNKQIDVLSRNSTWTMGRETEVGLVFAGITYYDGHAFLVPKSRNLQSALDLDGSKVCVQAGSTTEPNLSVRGIDISHETVRFCWNRFGPIFAGEIRRKRVAPMRGHPQWRWRRCHVVDPRAR
jgi:general L-amino acid transport system substrate-binding protein